MANHKELAYPTTTIRPFFKHSNRDNYAGGGQKTIETTAPDNLDVEE